MEVVMAPERGRFDVRSDEDLEQIADWLAERTGYGRPQLVRLALWALASRLGMPELPPLRRLLGVRPGRRRRVPGEPPDAP